MRLSISQVDASDTRRRSVPRLSPDVSPVPFSERCNAPVTRGRARTFPAISFSNDWPISSGPFDLVLFIKNLLRSVTSLSPPSRNVLLLYVLLFCVVCCLLFVVC